MAQTSVNTKLAFGIQGEFYDSSVRRVTPHTLGGAAVIGKAAWVDGDGKAYGNPSGVTGAVLTGIFVSPKEYINKGDVDAETLSLNAGEVAQVADLGHVNVVAKTSVSVGQTVFAATAVNTGATGYTGSWEVGDFAGGSGTTAPTATGVTFAQIPYAKFVRVTAATGEVAVVEFNG